MFQTFYENDFVLLEENLEQSLVHYYYKPNPPKGFMTKEDYIHSMTVYGERVNLHKHTLLLVDTTNSQFSITPDLQEWTAQVIAPLTISLKRMAFVLSPDIFSQVSLQQMMDEKGIVDKYEKPRYFENVDEAKAWLFEK